MNVSVRESAKTALEHAEADGKCRREWVCSCGACRIVRQAVGRLPRDRETVKLDRDLYRANREAKTMSYFKQMLDSSVQCITMDNNLMHKPDKLPTRAECKAMSKRLDEYMAIHKPQTRQQWAQQGAEYLALQALQISVDFLKLQEALEGRPL